VEKKAVRQFSVPGSRFSVTSRTFEGQDYWTGIVLGTWKFLLGTENWELRTDPMSDARNLLRHTLATLAYRGGKAIRNAPAAFADYGAPDSSRTPAKILAHIGDLMDWGLSMATGERKWNDSVPLEWEKECERFFGAMKRFDDYLASDAPLQAPIEKLFQGPIADALTHVGQLTMLRRLSGAPIKGENYFVADIAVGRVGAEQAAPKKEF